MNENEQRVVSIDPNEILQELGLSNNTIIQEAFENVDTSNDSNIEEVEFEEVEEESTAIVATTETNTLNINNRALSEEDLKKLIPVNHMSTTIVESTSRFNGADWFKEVQDSTIILAGCGGIGSNVLYLLSRMQPNQIFIYDDDVVETANLSGQMFTTDMIGLAKVNACFQLAKSFSDYKGVMSIQQKFTDTTTPGDIMICGFDSIEARKVFFKSWVKHLSTHPHPENCLFIDGRLAMEEFQVYCIKGDDSFNIRKYNETCFFDASEAEETLCSMKQTSHCAQLIAGVIVNLFTNFMANKQVQKIPRDLPFFTYYSAPLMYFKTEA